MIVKRSVVLISLWMVTCFPGASGVWAQQPDTKVTLGIKPDYWYTGPGVRVRGVLDDKAAQLAGMQAGDIIMMLNGKPIRDIFSYRDQLSQYAVGDSAIVHVKRKDKLLTLRSRFK